MMNSWTDIFAAEGALNQNILAVSDVIWTYLLVALLIGCGVFFTWKTRFVQFRMIREMIRLLTDSASTQKGEKHISSFQAFAVSVATRVGTGNLAGVATAITIGGPGSVFWMWLIALIGSASAFVESTLAQLFKQKHKDSFIGGPAYYILKGMRLKWMAALFARATPSVVPCKRLLDATLWWWASSSLPLRLASCLVAYIASPRSAAYWCL